MIATNFKKNFISKINEVLKFILESPYSSFYRNKYKNQIPKKIKFYEDFQKIPFLTKDDILAVHLNKRIFVPEEEISRYSFSSGTTAAKKVTILPHTSATFKNSAKYDIALDEEKMKKMGVRHILIALPSSSGPFLRHIEWPRKYTKVIPTDVNNLKLVATIARELKINCVVSSATILDFLIDLLKEVNFNLSQIKCISLGTEFCSVQKMEYFKGEFPNAKIYFGFGSSETGKRGYQCEYLAQKNPSIFHPVPHLLLEVVNEKGEVLPAGEIGELVYTNLEAGAFPLIRYKSNDYGSLKKESCQCGNTHILYVGGRARYDFLKFSGVALHTQAIANAVKNVSQYVEQQFQMHVFEKKENGKLMPQLELHLKFKKEFTKDKDNYYLKKTLKNKISANLRLSAKNTLKDLVEQNVFMPLEIVFLKDWPANQGKSINIISHLS